jgi:predicted CXXCH cytochrome family protein
MVSTKLFSQMLDKMPKHIVNLLLLLGFFMLMAFSAKVYLTDPSFYKYGHYRADAVPELAAGEPLYKGVAYCLECHEEREADWSTGAHVTVKCEVCHGTDPGHPDNGITMIKADKIRLCTTCHEEMPARPARQPQIVVAGHPFPDEETDQCHICHDPHAPQDDESTAAPPATEAPTKVSAGSSSELPEAAGKCAKCHGKNGEGRRKNPALAGLEVAVFIERMNMYISG